MLQPGWVLDADFNHDTRQLAVLSAVQGKGPIPKSRPKKTKNLLYQVTIYSVDSQGLMQAQAPYQLAPSSWDFEREGVSLNWQGQSLVLQDQALSRRVSVPQEVNARASPAVPASEPTRSASPPNLHGLSGADWRRVAQAKAAPIAFYSHPRFGGGLLLNIDTGTWHYLPSGELTFAELNYETTVFGFNRVQARLSDNGRRLIACKEGEWLAPRRCVLLDLPWHD